MTSRYLNPRELAQLNPAERAAYESSLKVYRDMYSVVEAAHAEGRQAEKEHTARQLKAKGFDISLISDISGLNENEIDGL